MTATIPWLHKVIVQPTLDFMAASSEKEWIASEGAQALLLGTAAAESNLSATRQHGNGPARSYFQVEPATANDILARYERGFSEIVYNFMPTDVPFASDRMNEMLRYSQAFACMVARFKYMDAKGALPAWNDVLGQAEYWKKSYNSEMGKGTIEHYQHQFVRHNILSYLEREFNAAAA